MAKISLGFRMRMSQHPSLCSRRESEESQADEALEIGLRSNKTKYSGVRFQLAAKYFTTEPL
jgi:hypothetical protein